MKKQNLRYKEKTIPIIKLQQYADVMDYQEERTFLKMGLIKY
jgi:hypothetical protein